MPALGRARHAARRRRPARAPGALRSRSSSSSARSCSSQVVEWRAPTFDTTSQRLFVVQLVLAVVLVARRPSYRSALIVGVFSGAALLGARNLVGRVARDAPGDGRRRSTDVGLAVVHRPAREPPAWPGVAGVAVVALLTMARFNQTDLELRHATRSGALAYLEERASTPGRCAWRRSTSSATSWTSSTGPSSGRSTTTASTCSPTTCPTANQAVITAAPQLRPQLDRLDIDLVDGRRRASADAARSSPPTTTGASLYVDDTLDAVSAAEAPTSAPPRHRADRSGERGC